MNSDRTSAKGVAWVTGASSGIGRAVCLALARRGWRVAASARRAESLRELEAEATDITGFPLDVTDADGCRGTVHAVSRALGPVDLAVLSAGTHRPVAAETLDLAVFRELWSTNVDGTTNALAAVLPDMLTRRRGHVAIVSSVAGYRGLPTAAAYGATKAALINLAEALKFDLDRLGVKIQIVNPGFVRTPLTDRNPFPMPFLISAEEAANRLVSGLADDAFEIAFPRRFAFALKLLRCLPYRLYFPLVRRLTRT
jgi:NADP-dependent 3-hydroxy acid dehydrogenase YdfG